MGLTISIFTMDVKFLLIKGFTSLFIVDIMLTNCEKIRVAFINVYRRILWLSSWSCSSTTHNIEL